MKLFKYIVFILCLIFPALGFGADKYVDCGLGGLGGSGSFADPYKSVEDLNDNKGGFSDSDDVYFKVATTCTTTEKFTITWTGTGIDYVIIGAYEGNGDFTMEGEETLPIIDGNSQAVPSTEGGLIQVSSASYDYITIQDLQVFESGWYGIMITDSDYVNVYRCLVSYSEKGGVAAFRTSNTTYDENTITQNCQQNNPTNVAAGGAFLIASQGQSDTDATITQNKVYNNWCTESIGINRGVVGGLVENNVVYDNKGTPGIYLDYVKDIVVRRNLIYRTNGATFDGPKYGLHINAEPYDYGHGCYNSGHELYGNLIAAMVNGISIGGQECRPDDLLIYNNDIVDSVTENIKIWSGGAGGSGNVIKNNISWILSGGGAHTSNCSASGYTWDYNLWDSDPGTGDCDAANDPANASPELSKASGWQSLSAGNVTGAEFQLTSGSPAAGAGLDLGNDLDYVLIPGDCDFTASPITCTAADGDDYSWPIGAFLGGLTISAGYPTSLQECTTDPRTVTFGVTSSANATCKFTIGGTCLLSYADLDETFENTTGTTHTDTDESFDCDDTVSVTVICNDGSYDSNCLGITVDVASGVTPPFPPPTGFGAGGNVSSGAGGNVTAGKQ